MARDVIYDTESFKIFRNKNLELRIATHKLVLDGLVIQKEKAIAELSGWLSEISTSRKKVEILTNEVISLSCAKDALVAINIKLETSNRSFSE